jgi:hypothetical protein
MDLETPELGFKAVTAIPPLLGLAKNDPTM